MPAVTFGAPPERTKRSGAGWNAGAFPRPDPDAPGPGEYAGGDDTRVLDKIAGKFRAPAFTFGGGKDDIGKVAAKDFAGAPGPGMYHIDEILAVAAERRRIEKGFSFGERVGAAWHEAGPGRDAPAPGTYADGTEVRRSGGGFSFGNAPKEPSFIPSSKDGPTPGPGDYLDREKEKEKIGGGENDGADRRTRKSGEGGFTFGWRRPDPAKTSTEPGPGAYHRDAQLDDPEALRPGPAFSLGTKLERGGALDGKKDAAKMPGPGDYEVRKSAEAGPSFTIPGRANDGVVVGVDLNEKASLPGPGRYHAPLSPGGRAYTLGSRIEEKDAKKDTPAPGEYGAPMPVGAEWGDRNRGFSVLGRDAWAGKGWGEEHAEVPGVGRYDVRGSNSKPLPSAPAFTMAGKTNDGRAPPPTRDIGPGEYDGDGADRPPTGPSFTIGVRGSKDGAYGDLKTAAERPGPGAYPNAPRAKDETRESAPSFTLGQKIDVPDERTKVGPGGFSERPGPGEYHADGDVAPPEGPGGFTIYERTKSTEFRPGVDSPGPAYYGGFTTDDVDLGLQMSIHERYESGSVFQHTDRSDTPGPESTLPRCSSSPCATTASRCPLSARPRGTPSASGGSQTTRFGGHRSAGPVRGSTTRKRATASLTRLGPRGSPSASVANPPESPSTPVPGRDTTTGRANPSSARPVARRPSPGPRFATENRGSGRRFWRRRRMFRGRPTTTRNPAPAASWTNARPPTASASGGTTPPTGGVRAKAPPARESTPATSCARPTRERARRLSRIGASGREHPRSGGRVPASTTGTRRGWPTRG